MESKILEDEIAEQQKIEREAKIKAEKKAAYEAKFNQAKETGIKVELSHWLEECNNPEEECSTDIVTRYAMPDGTVETVRNHTW